MPNPNTNFKDSNGTDLGNKLITVEYLMSVYPQIAGQIVTPELWTWGLNSNFAGTGFGQLGDGTAIQKLTPVTTSPGGANWKQVSCGNNHTAAVKKDGTLWTWGYDEYGELGLNDDDQNSELSPVQVGTATTWKQVSCGLAHTAAVKTDGTLWTWGRNLEGQLGINTLNQQESPVQTSVAGTTWKQVSCGGLHTTAIKTDGTLWAWGYNFYGQIGNGTTALTITPVEVTAGSTNWKQVSGGRFHTAAVKTDGTLWCWGQNAYGHLGDNTSIDKTTPTQVSGGGTTWKQVAGGIRHTVAVKTDGTLYGWGQNSEGQLGLNNVTSPIRIPTQVSGGGTNWKQVDADVITAAIKTDGTLWSWGFNQYGQIGNGTIVQSNIPVQTSAAGTNWKQVATGYCHTAAIKTSDNLLRI
jgi:alpha-tubulin suppressor-like RCC1 family protein